MRSWSVLVWLRLARIFQKINRDSETHLRTWNLNVAHFDVLAQVGSTRGLTQQELADRLLVTKGNISQLIDRMEKRGLLKRCQEGRANTLSLTEAGQQLYAEIVPQQEEWIASHFTTLTIQETEQLLHLLRKLDHSLA